MAPRLIPAFLCACVASSVRADAFQVKVAVRDLAGGSAAEILAGEAPVIRLRGGGEEALAQAQVIRDRLWQQALAGIGPADVSVSNGASPVVMVGDRSLVTVTPSMARAAGTTPQALAASWVKQLKAVFAKPYLALETTDLLVPYLEARSLLVGGTTTGPITVSMYAPDIIRPVVGPAGGQVVVRGLAVGTTGLAVRRGDSEAFLRVRVKKWAATFTAVPEAVVTGSTYDETVGLKAAINAAVNSVRLEPGARLQLQPDRAPENPAVFGVRVEAAGTDLIPARRVLTVEVTRRPSPAKPPAKLLISNDPESVRRPGDLLVGTVEPYTAARLLYHHKAAVGGGCRLVVALGNVSAQAAAVHVTDAVAGPHPDELFVGHLGAKRFLDRSRDGTGLALWIPPGRTCTVVDREVADGQVLSGLANLTVLTPTEVRVSVSALPAGSELPAYPPPVPDHWVDVTGMAGTVFAPVKQVSGRYEVGGGWLFLHVGKHGSQGPDGHVLHGDYGVDYDVRVDAENPTARMVQVDVAVRAGGGAARGLFHVDGRTVETQLLRSGQEQILHTFTLGPRQSRRIAIRTMPEAASSYPVTLIVRSR